MFGAAGRLIAVVFGFVMAVCVSALVAFRLGIERVTGALHGDEDPFGTVLGWLARGHCAQILQHDVIHISARNVAHNVDLDVTGV